MSEDEPQFTITFVVESKKLVPVMVTAVPPAVVGVTAQVNDEICKAYRNPSAKTQYSGR